VIQTSSKLENSQFLEWESFICTFYHVWFCHDLLLIWKVVVWPFSTLSNIWQTCIRIPSQWYRQTPFTNNEKLIKRATWTNNKDKPCVSISCSASGIRGVYCQIQANYSHNQVRWLRSFYENGTTSTVICEIDMLSPSTIQFLENDFRLIVATPCLSNILESRNTCSKFVVLSVIHAYILFIGMLLQNERDIHNWKIAIILFVVSRPSLSISGLRS
jgi:hypothetical protein